MSLIKVNFHKLCGSMTAMQIVEMDERLVRGTAVEHRGIMVASYGMPCADQDRIWLRGSDRIGDFRTCIIKFISDERMEEWLDNARGAIEKYVRLNAPFRFNKEYRNKDVFIVEI